MHLELRSPAVTGILKFRSILVSFHTMSQFFPPFNLPDDIILLVTDELSAPADFVLHRTLAAHLKRPVQRNGSFDHARTQTRAVILSVSEDLGRWKALASRSVRCQNEIHVFIHPPSLHQNISIQNHLDSGSVIFMDLLAGLQPPHSQQQLQVIFDRVQQSISRDSTNITPCLLILDDITTLEWVGFPPTDVQHFIRALRALCLKVSFTIHFFYVFNPRLDQNDFDYPPSSNFVV